MRIPSLCVLCLLTPPAAWAAPAPQSAPASVPASVPASLRDKLLGECRLADGKPWARAQVTLWSSPLAERWDFGIVDQVEAESDGEGQFKAALLPLRTYVALARAPGEGDAVWFSGVARGIRAGERLVLTRADTPERPTRLRLVGLDAWQKAGVAVADLRISASRGGAPPSVTPLAPDGTVTLPARPAKSGHVAVTLPEGRPLARRSLQVYAPGASRPEVIPYQVHPPVRVRVVVRVKGAKADGAKTDDKAKAAAPGPAIPGARLWLGPEYSRTDWHAVGTTDADGACDVWLEGAAGTGESGALIRAWHLQVDAPGHAILQVPLAASAGDDWDQAERMRTVTGLAVPGYTARGRLLGVDGKPLAGVRILLSIQGSEQREEHSYNGFSVDYRPVVTGADGSFELPSLDRHCAFHLLADAAQPGLFAPAEAQPAQALAVLAQGQYPGKPRLELGDLGDASVGVAAVEVRAPDGAPVSYPRAHLIATSRAEWFPPELPEIQGDRRGRVALRVPAGEYGLLVWDRGLARVETVVVKGGGSASPPRAVTLEKAVALRGRIVDAAGKPVPGASVRVMQTSSRGGAGMNDRERRGRGWFNAQGLNATADADGRVECWFLPIPGTTYGLSCQARVGERWVNSGIVQVSGEAIEDAEFVLPVVQPDPDTKGGSGDPGK